MGLGGFSEAFDEDFLGLRELGIAAELGLSSLSVPKRLLKGKPGGGTSATKYVFPDSLWVRGDIHELHDRAKPTEPPPPYPPPPPFVPITSKSVQDQIGLLRSYYQERLATLAPSMSAPPPVLGMPLIPPPLGVPVPGLEPMSITGPIPGPTLLTLPDDGLPSSQTKLGPIGQVVKSGASSGAVKKKAKATGTAPKDMGGGPTLPLPPGLLTLKPEDVSMEPMTTTPFDAGVGDGVRRGTKGALSGGNGNNGAKKKAVEFPPVIAASA